jgi:glycine/D-amino acid oxidase-like deaminating enzyme
MPSAVVVGAGVFGSALARQLALDGLEVTLVDQESPGWSGSASSGESRLFRCSHGTERSYVRSATRARELWREIDPRLLVDCGVAWFAHRDDGWEAESERVLRDEGVAVERLEPRDAARLFPSLSADDLAWVLFEPDAGVLRAHEAVGVLAAQAKEAGARVVRARAEPDGGRVRAGDAVLEADNVVWACGPWLGKLFPDVVELRCTRQVVVFFGASGDWDNAPGFIDYDLSYYGHGNLDDWGVKVASDAEGPDADPDALGDPGDAAVALARGHITKRFPALEGAPLRKADTCPYELTVDTHFIAAPHPEHHHVWLLGGGSGHGFKHAPALAERMAGWLRGDELPDPSLALGSRSVDTSLRTAGGRATPIGRRAPEEES